MVFGTLLIASAAVFFSVLGLIQTFSETAIYWGTSIEVAKLILASFLYRYWDKLNLVARTISIAFIALLMTITSLGIYGHIITSYQEGSFQVESQNILLENEVQKLDRIEQQIENVNRQIESNEGRIQAIQDDIARVPDNFVTVRRELIQERQPEMDRLENEISTLFEDREILYDELSNQQEVIAKMRIETGEVENKVGPIMFVIEQLGGAGERAVFWFVLIIVLSFDPTAVALTVYSNKVAMDLKSNKKEPNISEGDGDTIEDNVAEGERVIEEKEEVPDNVNKELVETLNGISETLKLQENTIKELSESNKLREQRNKIIKKATG